MGSNFCLVGLILVLHMINPSLMRMLAQSMDVMLRMANVCVCPTLLLLIGFIHLTLQIVCSLSPLTSSISLMWAVLSGLKTMGTLSMIKLNVCSLMCEPFKKASMKAISLSGCLTQFAASLLQSVSTSAPFQVLRAVSTWTFAGFSVLVTFPSELFTLVITSAMLLPRDLLSSSSKMSTRICHAFRSMSPKTLGSRLCLFVATRFCERMSRYDWVVVVILSVVLFTLPTLFVISFAVSLRSFVSARVFTMFLSAELMVTQMFSIWVVSASCSFVRFCLSSFWRVLTSDCIT